MRCGLEHSLAMGKKIFWTRKKKKATQFGDSWCDPVGDGGVLAGDYAVWVHCPVRVISCRLCRVSYVLWIVLRGLPAIGHPYAPFFPHVPLVLACPSLPRIRPHCPALCFSALLTRGSNSTTRREL